MSFFRIITFILLLSNTGFALQSSISPSFRLYPMAGDLTATLKQEGILYDRRTESDPTLFGLWQLAVMGDITGALEIAANYYPISFVRLTAALGGSYRYYNSPSFNCTLVNCQGFLARNRVGFAFMGVTGENNEWLLIPEYNMVMVSSSITNQPTGDESEVLLANGGGDTLDRFQVVIGKKIEYQFMGLMVRQAQYRNSGQHNELQALMMKSVWRDTSIMMGLGRYSSDQNVPGIAFFASYEWRWGYSQALF